MPCQCELLWGRIIKDPFGIHKYVIKAWNRPDIIENDPLHIVVWVGLPADLPRYSLESFERSFRIRVAVSIPCNVAPNKEGELVYKACVLTNRVVPHQGHGES